MTDTNVNMSVLEYERLTAERNNARLARKAIRRARYYRRYYRIRGRGTPVHMLRVADFVVVTVGPLTAGGAPLDLNTCYLTGDAPVSVYGTPAITRDDLT